MARSKASKQARRRKHAAAARRERELAGWDALEAAGQRLDEGWQEAFDAVERGEVAAAIDVLAGMEGDPVWLLLAGSAPRHAMRRGSTLATSAPEGLRPGLAEGLVSRLAAIDGFGWVLVGALGELDDPSLEGLALRAAEVVRPPEAAAEAAAMAAHVRLGDGRIGDCAELADEWCVTAPGNEAIQRVRLAAHSRAAAARRSDLIASWGEPPAPEQVGAALGSLSRYSDRARVVRLQEAVAAMVAADPALAAWQGGEVAGRVAEVLESTGPGGPTVAVRLLADDAEPADRAGPEGAVGELTALLVEQTWRAGPEGSDDPAEDEADSLLGRLTAAEGVDEEVAADARSWWRDGCYGLWQVDLGPVGAGRDAEGFEAGTWVTDILTRVGVPAALPAELVADLPRWSVLLGHLAPLGGVWHPGAGVVVLPPDLADEAAEMILAMTGVVGSEAAGLPVPRRVEERRSPRPFGALADVLDPMEEPAAGLARTILGLSLGEVVELADAGRRAAPEVRNTDGDEMEMLEVEWPCDDPVALRRRLLARLEWEEGDDEEAGPGDVAAPLRWQGRAMSATEAASMVERVRSMGLDAGTPPEVLRYYRGIVHFAPGRLSIELNSRRRLEDLGAILRRLGVEGPAVVRPSATPLPGVPPTVAAWGVGAMPDEAAELAWRGAWVDDPHPLLDGLTPREAAGDPDLAPELERVLRRWEHDADRAALDGMRPMDVAALRVELDLGAGLIDLTDELSAPELELWGRG